MCHVKHPMMMPSGVCVGAFKLGSGSELPGWFGYMKGHESNKLWMYCAENVLKHKRMVQVYRRNHLHFGDRMNGIRKFEDKINEAIAELEAAEQEQEQLAQEQPAGLATTPGGANAADAQEGSAAAASTGAEQANSRQRTAAGYRCIKRANCGGHLLENIQDHGRPYKEYLRVGDFWRLQQSRTAAEYAQQFVKILRGKPRIKAHLNKLPRHEWIRYAINDAGGKTYGFKTNGAAERAMNSASTSMKSLVNSPRSLTSQSTIEFLFLRTI